MKTKLLLFVLLVGLIYSCKKDLDNQDGHQTTPLSLTVPEGFPPLIIPADNPLTVEGVELGHHLFFDPIMSSNGLSCASCHHVDKSYSSAYHINPLGDTVSIMPHVNLGFKRNFSWTGRFSTTEQVCMGDFEPEFFNTNMDTLRRRLSNSSKYQNMFFRSFGDNNFSAMSDIELKIYIVK